MQQPTLAPAPHSHLSSQEAATSAEQTLRAHLLPHINSSQGATMAAPGTGAGAAPPPPPASQPAQPSHGQQATQPSPQTPMQMQQPQSPGMGMMSAMQIDPQRSPSGEEGTQGENQGKSRGGKRELSTSKRAAQNRAAQRAFRQRKEGYIKKLEEQVRDFSTMQESYKQIQNENYQLRDYIINLQSRLIESQGEDAVPPPPPSLVHPAPPLMTIEQLQQNSQNQQSANGPTAAPAANHQTPNAAAKRTHEDATNSTFLQSVAQAATVPTNGFVPVQHSPAVAPPPSNTGSPAAKRVKGEVDTHDKNEAVRVNGS